MPIKDMTGQIFERIKVLRQGPSDSNGNARWNCVCECGAKTLSHGFSLRNGAVKSCGCMSHGQLIARIHKHGHAGGKTKKKSPTYMSWASIYERCLNPTHRSYHNYGGRGITICERWRSFENFLADMGERPSAKHSIDRFPNNNGNYEPTNCRWATNAQQSENRRNNVIVTYKGERMILTRAATLAGLTFSCVKWRLNNGWSTKRALETPSRADITPPSPASSIDS